MDCPTFEIDDIFLFILLAGVSVPCQFLVPAFEVTEIQEITCLAVAVSLLSFMLDFGWWLEGEGVLRVYESQ